MVLTSVSPNKTECCDDPFKRTGRMPDVSDDFYLVTENSDSHLNENIGWRDLHKQ